VGYYTSSPRSYNFGEDVIIKLSLENAEGEKHILSEESKL